MTTKVRAWVPEPPSGEVVRSIARLSRLDDVVAVALMPDVHLAENVCIGAVVATRSGLYPDAVGGDIGCGMAAVRLAATTRALDGHAAEGILTSFAELIPATRHRQRRSPAPALAAAALATPAMQRALERSTATQLGTLGGGNHFLELQADEDDELWLMVHSGSRGFGPAVREHNARSARRVGGGLCSIDAVSSEGQAYLRDHDAAISFADANRRAILERAVAVLGDRLGASADWPSLVSCTHNFARRELHGGEELWVHRKGAISARVGEAGIIPGSMGAESFLVTGRGFAASLESSSHGAGRAMSREAARRRIPASKLVREMDGIWFDSGASRHLVDEAPSAYKPIAAVMRAQKELTRIEKRLRPLLNYKGV